MLKHLNNFAFFYYYMPRSKNTTRAISVADLVKKFGGGCNDNKPDNIVISTSDLGSDKSTDTNKSKSSKKPNKKKLSVMDMVNSIETKTHFNREHASLIPQKKLDNKKTESDNTDNKKTESDNADNKKTESDKINTGDPIDSMDHTDYFLKPNKEKSDKKRNTKVKTVKENLNKNKIKTVNIPSKSDTVSKPKIPDPDLDMDELEKELENMMN